MAISNSGYKEKYLQALDDQERLEKQFNAQMEYLRKTLFNISAAASGLDQQLDASMVNLRDKMRGATGAQVIDQMERVQRSVAEFERKRETENAAAASQIAVLVDQLLELRSTKELKERLIHFKKTLKKKMSNYRSYPAVVSEFCQLQKAAFDSAANPEESIWQRLKGGRSIALDQEDDATEKPAASSEGKNATEVVEEVEVQAKNEGEEEVQSTVLLGEEEVVVLDVGQSRGDERDELLRPQGQHASITLADDEDSYQEVAERIVATLKGLVENIEPNDVVRHRVDMVKARIDRGMDWYVLSVTLEDIRDILMQRYLDVDKEFSSYLTRVNEELVSIGESLGLAVEVEAQHVEAAETFSTAVSNQVKMMRSTVETASGIDNLKQAVTDHITAIQKALNNFDSSRSEGESLTDQLQALINKVHSVESESKKTKELLEEERHKATHDTLTTLPNREAYNERAFHEYQRFKRYCRPLTIAICDIDYFKKINDTYGHQAGDKVLKLIAKVVQTRLRKVDFIARFGGEEFVLLLPETTASKAHSVLDKIRAAVGNTAFRFKDKPVQITISFGITEFDTEDNVEDAFERADKALYQAKGSGRNRCEIIEGSG